MIKKLLGILVVAVVGVVLVAVLFGNVVLASVLSNALGAPVKIEKLKLGTETGIYGLVVGSPEGFQEERIVSIPEASVQLDAGALFKGTVHIYRIKLAMDEVTIEKKGSKINLLELKALKKSEKGEGAPAQEKPQDKPQPTEPGKAKAPSQMLKVQIDEVVIDLDKARYVDSGVTPASVKEYSLGVRNQSFKNVTDGAGLTKQVVFFILKKVGMSSLTENFDVLLKGVGGEVGTALGKLMDKISNG